MVTAAEAVRANVVESFRIPGGSMGGLLQLPPEDLVIVEGDADSESGPSIDPLMVGLSMMPLPWFFHGERGALDSPQRSFFGLFVLRAAWRGCAIGGRFFQAGDLLRASRFLAAAVTCYYTASYHLLEGYLALNGRLFIDKPLGQPKIEYGEGSRGARYVPLSPRESLLATFDQATGWRFELTQMGHARRWNELRDLLLAGDPELPPFLEEFLSYITTYGEYQVSDREQLLTQGVERLAAGRHEAIYGGYGYDDFIFDALSNREAAFGGGLSLRVSAYRDLARGFLDYCTRELVTLRESIPGRDWANARPKMALSLMSPPFELEFDSHMIKDEPEITQRLGMLLGWWILPPRE